MATYVLRYDLRAPAWGPATHAELYAACLEQCAWADDKGFSMAVISEHHGVAEDGYMSSPLVVAAAIAGRTRALPISIQALLVPLHDPLRLAEDLAALDLMSGGRSSFTAGLGYRDEEFEMFGVDRRRRAPILEETVEVLRRAWTGEPFEHRGRTVRVTPRPLSQPHPLMFIGGSVPVSARRAARMRLPFWAAVGDPLLAEVYRAECAAVGYGEGFAVIPEGVAGFVHVTEDPERAWADIAPHALHEARSYASWQHADQRSQVHVEADDLDALKASGVYRVVTPDECVELARGMGPMGALVLHPLMGGMSPELGWASLELFAAKVAPRL